MPRITAEQRDAVQRGLAMEAERLARAALPDGQMSGREWIGHGPDGAKWGVVTAGPRAGRWRNFGGGEGGTLLLSFVRDAVCGGDYQKAWSWAVAFLGGHITEIAERPRPPARKDDAAQRSESGIKMWLAAEPFAWDGPAGRYLEGRGLERGYFDRPPGALRFHRAAFNGECGQPLPAMVAGVLHAITYKHIAVHRTWLEYRDGGWHKAARLENQKTSLGPVRGGIVPLTRGESTRPYSRAPAGDVLILAEGIENALTVAAVFPRYRSAAYISAANLISLELPEAFQSVLLVEDRDGENAGVIEARQETMFHWQREGRAVYHWSPTRGTKDANDLLRAAL